jgi:hypothetical protein
VAADPYSQTYVPPAGLAIDPSDIEDLGDIEVSDQEDREIREAVDRAECDIPARTVTVRLTGEQLAFLERAAASVGIGVNTYVKEAALRRAVAERSDVSGENGASR